MSVVALIMYTVCFAPGMGPVPWAVNSEIYPLNLREMANSIATMSNWISNFIVSVTFLSLTKAITPAGAFYLYADIALLAFVVFFFFLPETKGKNLEQIQELFAGTNPDIPPPAFQY